MLQDPAKPPFTRERFERAPGIRDRDELFGTRPRREVLIEGDGLDRRAGLARDYEERPRSIVRSIGVEHRGGVRAVQHLQHGTRPTGTRSQHLRRETRSTHAAYERAVEPGSTNLVREFGEPIPFRERAFGGANPTEAVHWRQNIMRLG